MHRGSALVVKIASEAWEFEEIHRLNHETFTKEVPQHQSNQTGHLIDRFHDENTYVIAIDGGRVAGMIAVRGQRPFSLDHKLPNLDAYLPAGRSIGELRLLAVDKQERMTRLLPSLLERVWRHCLSQGFDMVVISAVLRQLKLYQRIGFEAFGPLVGTPPVLFQPMSLTLEQFVTRAPRLVIGDDPSGGATASFLPGPVDVSDDVRAAMQQPPASHRSPAFHAKLDATKARLRSLVNARRVEILLGSGTTANDVIAGQISLESSRGLVLSNGEFGERLVDHATRWKLAYDVLTAPWGDAFDIDAIARALTQARDIGWLWCVHCETSTGVLNDLDAIRDVCRNAGVKLCVDAVSSIGTTDVDLGGAFLASGVSGKALGAFPGLAIVFHDHEVSPAPTSLPRAHDLGMYTRDHGVPFTHSSNLLDALDVALASVSWPARFRDVAETAAWLRARLRTLGFTVVGAPHQPAPGVVTIALPEAINSVAVSDALERYGFVIAARSSYLATRNWIQIGLMGPCTRPSLATLTALLLQACNDVS